MHSYNQETNFGTSSIENQIGDGEWKNCYPGCDDLDSDDQKETETAIIDASVGLLLEFVLHLMDICVISDLNQYLQRVIQVLLLLTRI